MIGSTLEQKIMETKPTDKVNIIHDTQENNVTSKIDDASKLWNQYQKQRSKKKLGACILFSFVVVIIVILVIIGLYIVLSTTDPLNSL
jgi:t-SNARE complex subunit (syntaxin)